MAHRNRWFTELLIAWVDFPWRTVSHNQMVSWCFAMEHHKSLHPPILNVLFARLLSPFSSSWISWVYFDSTAVCSPGNHLFLWKPVDRMLKESPMAHPASQVPRFRVCRGRKDVGIKVNSRKVLGAVLRNSGVPVARSDEYVGSCLHQGSQLSVFCMIFFTGASKYFVMILAGWWFQTFFIFHFIYGMSSFPTD